MFSKGSRSSVGHILDRYVIMVSNVIGPSSNGRTAAFGAGNRGSSPCGSVLDTPRSSVG